jgi:hypothetical protein
MKVYLLLQLLMLACALQACSFKFEAGYHGQTGRDDRVISQGLYPEGISQKRGNDQRY